MADGKRINKKVEVRKFGKKVPNTMETTFRAKRRVGVGSPGMMELTMKESGKATGWKEQEFFSGLTEEGTKVSTKMIRGMVMGL